MYLALFCYCIWRLLLPNHMCISLHNLYVMFIELSIYCYRFVYVYWNSQIGYYSPVIIIIGFFCCYAEYHAYVWSWDSTEKPSATILRTIWEGQVAFFTGVCKEPLGAFCLWLETETSLLLHFYWGNWWSILKLRMTYNNVDWFFCCMASSWVFFIHYFFFLRIKSYLTSGPLNCVYRVIA